MSMKPEIFVLIACAVAGAIASAIHIPAAWLIGPLLVSAYASVKGHFNFRFPKATMLLLQAIIGVSLAGTFSPGSLTILSQHWLPVAGLVLSMQALTVLNAIYFVRVNGVNPATALLGTLPGGAGEMTAVSESLGADPRLVSVMQYTRLLVIILFLSVGASLILHVSPTNVISHSVPAELAHAQNFGQLNAVTSFILACTIAGLGGFLGPKLRIPAGIIMVPLALAVWSGSAGYPALFPLPVLSAVYATLGIKIGCQFDADVLERMKTLMLPLLGTSTFLAIGSIVIGALFAHTLQLDPMSAYLASTPGGLDSVAVVATELKADIAIVLCVHFSRLFLVLITGPTLVQLFAKLHGNRVDPAPIGDIMTLVGSSGEKHG